VGGSPNKSGACGKDTALRASKSPQTHCAVGQTIFRRCKKDYSVGVRKRKGTNGLSILKNKGGTNGAKTGKLGYGL